MNSSSFVDRGQRVTVYESNGVVTITKEGENWGDPWPVPNSSVTINDLSALIDALKSIQREKYREW